MTDKEKLNALLNALVEYVGTVDGVDASILRQALADQGLIDFRLNDPMPGAVKAKRIV